ncbi:ATP-binding protein [Pseudomonas aeruginosa]|uniref:AAA family ATPase n=1 Tax=Pseudomonas aeruginosa TaxID=287 RepID=UPI0009A44E3A|nr:ATP-binding protein [Pseudomonas aeruginosa]ELC0913964.1 ATP-binding protein [Pseudomonas aeruginosa]ELC0919001.1 ATP-binding protein [Pseudomonas aeruginosa]ELG7938538.1 ATP-binding protein [Pseudomonas aeruginosa]ELG7944411.1 ATP-binding protein [Pseudomonas aeruginosa]ELJ2242395.1 ATP-binding protein [Pseudomonas aeruginosa]
MLKSFELENFGPLATCKGKTLGAINLVIGGNGAGKTFLLKALYAAIRTQEEFGRGHDRRDFSEVLSDKLYWTFQVEKLGDLVRKGEQNRLRLSIINNDNCALTLEFGQDTSKKVNPVHNNLEQSTARSIFLPPKEVLSLTQVIMKSAFEDRVFGFDATYSDLVLALQLPPVRGRNPEHFKRSRDRLEDMFQGRLVFDQKKNNWIYKKGNTQFSINATAEGIKKIAILDTLLANRYLSAGSIVFIDEAESALHPSAISELMDIVEILAEGGIQFFIATHSYFVVKKLYIIALRKKIKIPILMAGEGGVWSQSSFQGGMPDNPIIRESIRLFEEELEASIP